MKVNLHLVPRYAMSCYIIICDS